MTEIHLIRFIDGPPIGGDVRTWMRTERTLGHQFDGASELLREDLLRLKPPGAVRRSILGRAKRDDDISELTPDRRVSRRVAHGCQTPL